MKRKTIAAIAIMMLIALATIGVGYGLWFEVLVVDGEVNTGEVDVAITNWQAHEFATNADGTVFYWDLAAIGKDYQGCEAYPYDHPELIPPGMAANLGNTQDDGTTGLFVNVTNTFPSYHCFVEFEIQNVGTVPVHLDGPTGHPGYDAPEWITLAQCFDANFIGPQGEYDPQGNVKPAPMPQVGLQWYVDNDLGDDDLCYNTAKQHLSAVNNPNAPDNMVTSVITNNAPEKCTYLVGLATYEWQDGSIDGQHLFDYDTGWAGADPVELAVVKPPDCKTQWDAFFGEVYFALNGNRYSHGTLDNPGVDRKLGSGNVGEGLCDPEIQLEPGDIAHCGVLVHFTNEDFVSENVGVDHIGDDGEHPETGYLFGWAIMAHQWNENADWSDIHPGP